MEGWPDPIPDGIEPFVGYRLWAFSLTQKHPQLFSPLWHECLAGSQKNDWEGAESRWVVASCVVQEGARHFAPAEDCGCGFYAMSTLGRLIAEMGPIPELVERIDDMSEQGFVLGRVALAGKVIEHEYGYRAGRARVLELIPIQGSERSVARLALRLGLPMGSPVPLLPKGPGPRSPASQMLVWFSAAAVLAGFLTFTILSV